MKKILITIMALTAFAITGFAQTYDEVGDKSNISSQELIQEVAANSVKNALKLDKMFDDDKEMTSGLVTLDALYLSMKQASKLTSDNSQITQAIADKKVTAAMLKQYKANTTEIAKLTKDAPATIALVPKEIAVLKDEIKAKPTQAIKLGKNVLKANKTLKNCKDTLEIIKDETVAQAKVLKAYNSKK